MRNFLFILGIAAVVVGCASGPKTADKFDEDLNTATSDGKEKVGIVDGKVVIQKRQYLDEQLAKFRRDTDDLQNDIFGESVKYPGGLWFGLKDCRQRLSDPRIGGNGIPEPMERWERVMDREMLTEYKVKGKEVIVVKQENLDDRINAYKKGKRILESQYQGFKRKLNICEQKYRTALVQHGLNPDDTKASGQWVEGPNGYKVWKMVNPATKDPEELMRRKEQAAKK